MKYIIQIILCVFIISIWQVMLKYGANSILEIQPSIVNAGIKLSTYGGIKLSSST